MSFSCIALASLNKKENKGQISVLNYMHCSVIMSNLSMSCSLWIKNATESINPIFVLMRLALKLYHELVETSLIAHSMFHFPLEEIALSEVDSILYSHLEEIQFPNIFFLGDNVFRKEKKSGMVFWILRVAFVCLCVCIYIQFLHTWKCLALVAYVSDLSNTIMYLFSSESSCYNLSLHYNCSSSLAPSSIYFFILIIPWSHCLVYFSGREFIILFLTNFDRTSFF